MAAIWLPLSLREGNAQATAPGAHAAIALNADAGALPGTDYVLTCVRCGGCQQAGTGVELFKSALQRTFQPLSKGPRSEPFEPQTIVPGARHGKAERWSVIAAARHLQRTWQFALRTAASPRAPCEA